MKSRLNLIRGENGPYFEMQSQNHIHKLWANRLHSYGRLLDTICKIRFKQFLFCKKFKLMVTV